MFSVGAFECCNVSGGAQPRLVVNSKVHVSGSHCVRFASKRPVSNRSQKMLATVATYGLPLVRSVESQKRAISTESARMISDLIAAGAFMLTADGDALLAVHHSKGAKVGVLHILDLEFTVYWYSRESVRGAAWEEVISALAAGGQLYSCEPGLADQSRRGRDAVVHFAADESAPLVELRNHMELVTLPPGPIKWYDHQDDEHLVDFIAEYPVLRYSVTPCHALFVACEYQVALERLRLYVTPAVIVVNGALVHCTALHLPKCEADRLSLCSLAPLIDLAAPRLKSVYLCDGLWFDDNDNATLFSRAFAESIFVQGRLEDNVDPATGGCTPRRASPPASDLALINEVNFRGPVLQSKALQLKRWFAVLPQYALVVEFKLVSPNFAELQVIDPKRGYAGHPLANCRVDLATFGELFHTVKQKRAVKQRALITLQAPPPLAPLPSRELIPLLTLPPPLPPMATRELAPLVPPSPTQVQTPSLFPMEFKFPEFNWRMPLPQSGPATNLEPQSNSGLSAVTLQPVGIRPPIPMGTWTFSSRDGKTAADTSAIAPGPGSTTRLTESTEAATSSTATSRQGELKKLQETTNALFLEDVTEERMRKQAQLHLEFFRFRNGENCGALANALLPTLSQVSSTTSDRGTSSTVDQGATGQQGSSSTGSTYLLPPMLVQANINFFPARQIEIPRMDWSRIRDASACRRTINAKMKKIAYRTYGGKPPAPKTALQEAYPMETIFEGDETDDSTPYNFSSDSSDTGNVATALPKVNEHPENAASVVAKKRSLLKRIGQSIKNSFKSIKPRFASVRCSSTTNCN